MIQSEKKKNIKTQKPQVAWRTSFKHGGHQVTKDVNMFSKLLDPLNIHKLSPFWN